MFKHNTYVNKDQLSPSKKVLSNFLDGLFVFIISFLLVNFASIPILKNNNHFKEQINDLTSTVCQLYDIQEEAKLSYRVSEEEIYTEGKLFDEYINSHILTSYSYHQDKFNEKQIVIDDLSNKATYENDYLGYYYVNYKYNNNINIEQYNNKTPKQYFVEDIILGSDCASYYETHDDNIPSLTSDVAIDLYEYLNKISEKSLYYNDLYSFFSTNSRSALSDLNNYEPYNNLYIRYTNIYKDLAGIESLILVLTFTLTYIVIFALPQIFFNDGLTLGRLITKTRLIHSKNVALSLSLNIILNYIKLFFLVGIIGTFSFGLSILAIPLGGWFNVLIFVLVSFVLLIVDFFFRTFSANKISLIEKFSFTDYVNIKRNEYDE